MAGGLTANTPAGRGWDYGAGPDPPGTLVRDYLSTQRTAKPRYLLRLIVGLTLEVLRYR